MRLWRDAKDLYRTLVDLLIVDDPGEEAGYELAVSARRFSQNTQAVVDDKLNFSATLMRAGEVDAANRLLAEFERDVREEEAALIERVNEVKVAEAVRREGLTRVRLARVLAVALVGSSLLSFSAAGMALAGFVRDRAVFDDNEGNRVALPEATQRGEAVAFAGQEVKDRRLKRIRIGDVKLVLTASQLRMLREVAGGTPDESGLQQIIGLLPEQLAEKVQKAIGVAAAAVEDAKDTVQVAELADARKARKRAARQAEKAAEAEQTPEPEPSDPAPTEEPQPQESEEPPPDDDGDNDALDDDDDKGEAEDDDGLPFPDDDDTGGTN